MKICFCLFGRMGDVCCGIPAFQALKRKYPDAELTWATAKDFVPLIPKYAKIEVYGRAPLGSGWPKWANLDNYDKVYKVQPSMNHKNWERSKKHAIDCIADWSEIKLESQDRRINIDTSANDMHIAGKLDIPKRPFATICSSPSYSAGRYWSPALRQQITDHLISNGIKNIITVGGKDGLAINGAKHAHGKLTFLQTICLIRMSSLYIGPDNGVTWLSCAARGTSKVAVLNHNRLKTGVIGFQNVLDDRNVIDVFTKDGLPKIINNAVKLWKESI